MIALIDAYRAGLFERNHWFGNITAGLIVGIVALPLAMAFAIASGAKPEQGIYTAIVAALLVGLFGGSRVQIAGPTGAFVVILASITARYGIEGLQTATLLAGCFLILMGIFRLGKLIEFIPHPVITGFTTGIGCLIFVGEWKDFFGLPIHPPLDMSFYEKLILNIKALPIFHWHTFMLGMLTLCLLAAGRYFKKIPAPLVAMLIVTAIQYFFQFPDVATIGSAFGGIPRTLPPFHLVPLSFHEALVMLKPAFAIALLGAIESLLSATAADKMANTKHHANQELIGQGLANIFSPLLGGFAATGAIARTATNIKNGGTSPIASVVHSIFLLMIILLLAPLAAQIPLCVLAGILFVVAYHMSDIPLVKKTLLEAPYQEITVMLITFFMTVFFDLVTAVCVGVLFSMIFRYSALLFEV